MNQREKEILKLEKDLKDTLENDLIQQNNDNKKVKIKDIKLVGEISWNDKINGNLLTENVFIVEKEMIEIDENGNENKSEVKNYYLGDKCIGGTLGDNQIVFSQTFVNAEPEKAHAINDLLDRTSEEEIENNSLNKLQKKELSEILSAHLGRKVTEEEVEKLLNEMSKEELEEISEEKNAEENKGKDENDLSEKQLEKIKVNGVQKVELDQLVDGRQTLGMRLDLEQYEDLYVIYSDNVDEVTPGTKRNNTTYSLVGTTKDGQARILNDEFEMDSSVGNNASREQTKIRANSTATRDNNDLSVYTRKSNGASIGCENDMGHVNMFFYQRTIEENENVGIQIETSQTPIIPIETREIMNSNKGMYHKEKVQDEIQKHTEINCNPEDERDFDGYDSTSTHEHEKDNIDKYVMEIYNYENENGEEKIKEVFTQEEVRDKFLRELNEYGETLSIEQIVKNVEDEMNRDAEILSRERNQ